MLAIHWTPVNNTKHILKNGIKKSKTGLYCFPLTGIKTVDKWWVHFFNIPMIRGKKNYNGILFKILEEDMPASWGHWVESISNGRFEKTITSVAQLKQEYKETILWRMGESIAYSSEKDYTSDDPNELFPKLAQEAMAQSPKAYFESLSNAGLMHFALEDYQIILSHSIPAKRIMKVMPQGNEFGRVLRKEKINKGRGLDND